MKQKILTPVFRHTSPELKSLYLSSSDGRERSCWQAIWLLSRRDRRFSKKQVADITGYRIDWVRKTILRYNAGRDNWMSDGRRSNHRPRTLSLKLEKKLRKAVSASRPPGQGLWTGPKVAQWMRDEAGKKVNDITGWRYLNYLGFSLQIPRLRHAKSAAPEEREAFKKNSPPPYRIFRKVIPEKP
jgi:transposase